MKENYFHFIINRNCKSISNSSASTYDVLAVKLLLERLFVSSNAEELVNLVYLILE